MASRTEKNWPRVPPNELWNLLLCMVRYSIGRRTYAPSEAADLVRKYRAHLTPDQLDQIAREVLDEVRRSRRLYDKPTGGFDDIERTWLELVEDLGR